jgi:hypothetical protein
MKVKQSQFFTAEPMLRKVLAHRKELLPEGDHHLVLSLLNLAECLHLTAQPAKMTESIEYYSQAVRMLEQTKGAHDPGTYKYL